MIVHNIKTQDSMLRGQLANNVLLSKHTSWKVGGPARAMYKPADIDDLSVFLKILPNNEPLLFLGLGSNVLVRDGGFNGSVIMLRSLPDNVSLAGQSSIHSDTGITLAKLAKYCAKEGLSGAEFLAGIPGTLGGALAMNAGAHDSDIWSIVERVETLDRYGNFHKREKSDFTIDYRSVTGPAEECFISAVITLAPGKSSEINEKIKKFLSVRNSSQPVSQHSCGSVFRNPPGHFAGRLIEDAGLKGYRSGGASVSEKHANFIVTEKGATATDVEDLVKEIIAVVYKKYGVCLYQEVKIIGGSQ